MTFRRSLWVLPPLLLACILWIFAGRPASGPAVVLLQADMRVDDGAVEPAHGDAQHWQPLDQQSLARLRGPYWVRLQYRIGTDTAAPQLGLVLSLRGASEVSWDGVPLGRNGRIGLSVATEEPGAIDWFTPLPRDATAAGQHTLLVRASSQRLGFGPRSADVAAQIAPIDALFAQRYRPWLVAALAIGCIVLAGLYFALVLWRSRRRREPGAITLLGLGTVGVLLPTVEAWRPLLGYPYDLHMLRLCVILALTMFAAILLPRYLALRHAIAMPAAVRVLFVVVLLASAWLMPGFDGKALAVHLAGLLVALWLSLRALRDGYRDAGGIAALLLATLAWLLVAPAAFLDGLYFIALAVLMVFLLLRHSDHLLALGEINAQLDAQRAKLGAQLLRNGIHPHWLMNTLTSLQELIERAPDTANRMVDLLACEFRLLRQIGEQSLIPLQTEVELCRAHLDIVAMAHDVSIAFDVDGTTAGIEVPPGVLHTLVENGLTHAGVPACARDGFRLRVERTRRRVRLQLRSARGATATANAGTGTRFIEASLEVAFARGGAFRQRDDDGLWLSEVDLPCAS